MLRKFTLLAIVAMLLVPIGASAAPAHRWYSPLKNKWFWIEAAAQVGMYTAMAVNSSQPCGGCSEANTLVYGHRPTTGRVLAIGVPANIALIGLNLAAWDVSQDMTGGWKVAGHIAIPAIAIGGWGGVTIHDSILRHQCLQAKLGHC